MSYLSIVIVSCMKVTGSHDMKAIGNNNNILLKILMKGGEHKKSCVLIVQNSGNIWFHLVT